MTYVQGEAAHADPVELYRFSLAGRFWRWTSADTAFTTPGGETFQPEPLLREALEANGESGSNGVEVHLAFDNELAAVAGAPTTPGSRMLLSIFRTHRGSAYAPGVVFAGEVARVRYEGREAILECLPMKAALSRAIPVRLASAHCSNALGDERCKVDLAAYGVAAAVSAVSGRTVGVSGIGGYPAGYFGGGFVTDNATGEAAAIREHPDTATLVLLHNPGLAVGHALTVKPGCDKLLPTCHAKYGNTVNFQGFPYYPKVDPFKGGIR